MWIFLILGIINLILGFYIFKYKKFNLAYFLFYSRSIEKYLDKDLVMNKDEVSEVIGKNMILFSLINTVVSIIFISFNINIDYMLIFLLIIAIYGIPNRFRIKKIIKKK